MTLGLSGATVGLSSFFGERRAHLRTPILIYCDKTYNSIFPGEYEVLYRDSDVLNAALIPVR